jgi:hypothetical protein
MSSWLSKNYEKASIGGAAVAALGLALLGWSKVGQVKDDFSAVTKGDGYNDPAVAGAPFVAKGMSSFARKLSWARGETDGRQVDLFTGIPLFIHHDAPDTAVDLIKGKVIHEPIPNTWWIQHRLDPGFADSPSLDPDGEGFTNLEEFEGKTDPTDAASHPPLIGKLKYEKDESVQWALRPPYVESGSCPFTYKDTKGGKNKNAAGQAVKPGELFFAAGEPKNRFKFIGLETRSEMNNAIKMVQENTYAKVEDQKPNKKGMLYEYKVGYPEGDVDKWAKFDRSAVLRLEAAGNEGQLETVEENTLFGLPLDNPKKEYLLKKVTPENIEVEFTDPKTGEKTSVSINKGAFPTKAP